MSYPVYDSHYADLDRRDLYQPIGRATTERGARRILNRYFAGTSVTPRGPLLHERWGVWGWFDAA